MFAHFLQKHAAKSRTLLRAVSWALGFELRYLYVGRQRKKNGAFFTYTVFLVQASGWIIVF
jgi:hypothetical protein